MIQPWAAGWEGGRSPWKGAGTGSNPWMQPKARAGTGTGSKSWQLDSPTPPPDRRPPDFGTGPLPHSPTPTAYPAISPKERRYRAYRIICQPGRYRADLPTWYPARHEKIRHLDGTGSRSKRRAYLLSRSNLIKRLRAPQITSIMTIAIFHLHFPPRAGCAFGSTSFCHHAQQIQSLDFSPSKNHPSSRVYNPCR